MISVFRCMLVMCGLAMAILFMSILQPYSLFGTEYEVRVINGFSDNSSLPLVIWCTTEEGVLGGRAMMEGDDFGWRVRNNLWGYPHYLCTMKWDAMRRRFHPFKVPRDSLRCALFKKCSWLVKEDGFYFSNDEIIWKKDFSW